MRHILGEIDLLGEFVPSAICDRYHDDLCLALDEWMAKPDDEATAAWVFWFLFDAWNKYVVDDVQVSQLSNLDAVESLLHKRLRSEVGDRVAHVTTGICYQYAAMSLVYLLDAMDETWSERACELRDGVARLQTAGILPAEGRGLEDELSKARDGLRVATHLQLFDAAVRDRRFEDAMTSLKWLALWGHLFERYRWALDHIDPASAVAAFEGLWDSKPTVRGWSKLGTTCALLRMGYDNVLSLRDYEDEPSVLWKEEELEVREFWRYAEVLCASQMSPSEYRTLRQEDLGHASERRLKTYFFRDTWAGLPRHIQDRLVAIDFVLFSDERQDMGGVVESLWGVAKELIHSVLWDPFVLQREAESWRARQTERAEVQFAMRVEELAGTNREPTAKDFWNMVRLQSFRRFVLGVYGSADVDFLEQRLPKDFQALNESRNAVAHRKGSGTAITREEVLSLYARFMGVDCDGVLPRLARLLVRHQQGTKKISG